ncbi:MAG: aldo/keto reductase [Bacteroidota bacterium]
MQFRPLGKSGFQISTLSLGTWQVGGKWGSGFDHANAERILHDAIDAGINFIDTADVYESGESEKAVGKVVRERSEQIYVATKCGRQLNPHTADRYTPEALRGFVEESLQRTGLERLDLIQLHCPPTEIYYRPEIFGLFEQLQAEGKIGHLGVSVEKVEEALKAIEYDNVVSVQIIFNMFRHRPAGLFFEQARKRNVGIIARVPLASGILTGKYHRDMAFSAGDHRHFNRNGEAFDKGETFSGVPFEIGLDAAEALKDVLGTQYPLTHWALAWVLAFDEVSTVIPGASRPEQLHSNLQSLNLPALTETQLQAVREIYEEKIKPIVHHLW